MFYQRLRSPFVAACLRASLALAFRFLSFAKSSLSLSRFCLLDALCTNSNSDPQRLAGHGMRPQTEISENCRPLCLLFLPPQKGQTSSSCCSLKLLDRFETTNVQFSSVQFSSVQCTKNKQREEDRGEKREGRETGRQCACVCV